VAGCQFDDTVLARGEGNSCDQCRSRFGQGSVLSRT